MQLLNTVSKIIAVAPVEIIISLVVSPPPIPVNIPPKLVAPPDVIITVPAVVVKAKRDSYEHFSSNGNWN